MTDKEYRITSRLARLQAASGLIGQAVAHMLEGQARTDMLSALKIVDAQVTHDEQNIQEMVKG